MKRTLLLCLASCLAALASGCACNSWVHAPFGPGTICDSSRGGCGPCAATTCGPTACGSTCEPVCDDCGSDCGGACGVACGGPCETACGGCGEDCCAACCPPRGPLTWLFSLLARGYCGPSCGEVWWGDWHGAPPDCSDPCNRCGEFTGGGAPACESCGTGHAAQVRQFDTPHVAGRCTNGNACGRSVGANPAGSQVTRASSKYTPQLMSISDRVVDTSQPGSVPQATLPRRMPAHR